MDVGMLMSTMSTREPNVIRLCRKTVRAELSPSM
jgi:hypothetical protein